MAHSLTVPSALDLSSRQFQALRSADQAVASFWQSVDDNRDWWISTMEYDRPVINCCILAALAVRDILHGMGHRDATVFRTGLHLESFRENEPSSSITFGSPDGIRHPMHWNAHMVVKFSDLIIDPTIGQARAFWQGGSRSGAFRDNVNAGNVVHLTKNYAAHVTTQIDHYIGGSKTRVSYFKLPMRADLMTKNWRGLPDAQKQCRSRFVDGALSSLRPTTPTLL